MKALDKIRELSNALKPCGCDVPIKEAELLISHELEINLLEMYRDNPEVNEGQSKRLDDLCKRRLAHEPIQYLLGHVEFLHLRLNVGKDVLIPRPETELMAEHAIKFIRARLTTFDVRRPTVLDLCTGSGCLALSIAGEFPELPVLGIDISKAAINTAKENARINNIKNADFLCGDLFEPLMRKKPIPQYTLIISNPPYIKTNDIRNLQPEISTWEPVSALDGGKDGLDFYRRIIHVSTDFLQMNGTLILETGDGQAYAVAEMLDSAGFSGIQTIKDMAGKNRMVRASWTK